MATVGVKGLREATYNYSPVKLPLRTKYRSQTELPMWTVEIP